jgi:hypothetical protein
LLLSCGLGEDLVDQLQKNAINELEEGKPQYYMKYQTVYASKKHPVIDGPIPGPRTVSATGPDADMVVE